MRIRNKIRWGAVLLLFGYAIIRTLLVWAILESYGVNPWLFLIIDMVTAVGYVFGLEYLVLVLAKKKAMSMPLLIFWALITASCFASPYLYMYIVSRELPLSLGVGIGIIIFLLLLNVVFSVRRRVRINKHE